MSNICFQFFESKTFGPFLESILDDFIKQLVDGFFALWSSELRRGPGVINGGPLMLNVSDCAPSYEDIICMTQEDFAVLQGMHYQRVRRHRLQRIVHEVRLRCSRLHHGCQLLRDWFQVVPCVWLLRRRLCSDSVAGISDYVGSHSSPLY